MSRIDKSENELQDSIELGRRSKSLIPKIKNWCSNIKIESSYGGMIGQMGLPTMNSISCTQFRGDSAMNLEWIAHDFIVENCPNCKFHKEIIPKNFGRKTIEKYQERKQKEKQEKAKELKIIKQLEQKLDEVLSNPKEILTTTESSILRLLISLKETNSDKLKKSQEIYEASKLSPDFFNSLSIDYLSIFFKDELVKDNLINTAYSIIQKDAKIISDYFIDKIISLIKKETKVDNLLRVLPFNVLREEQIFSISPYLIDKYDSNSFNRYDHFENHSPSIISFFKNLHTSHTEEFYTLFKQTLKKENSNIRANAVLILSQLFSINNNIAIPLIKDLIESLNLQDSDYPKSADYTISKTLVEITKLHAEYVFKIINKGFENLTVGGKVEIFRFYKLFVNDSVKNSEGLFTKNIVSQLIKICLDKNPDKLKEESINTIKSFSQKTPEVLLQDFDSFIGVLSQSIIEKSTFKWYKEDLDKNTLTFNPLKERNIHEIMLEESKLDSEIDNLKNILINLLKYNQNKLYEKLIEIIRNINEGDKNSTQLKLFFIEIIRNGVNDSIVLTNILPDLHTWLLDFKNIQLRVEALRFLEKLLSNNLQIIPQTIFSLLEIFIEDNDNLIRKYAILCYKQILVSEKELKEHEINTLLNLLENKYVIIHKTAVEITYKLFDLLDSKKKIKLLSYLIRLLEIYHNETDRDVKFCKKLFRLTMYVSKEANPNHSTKTEKVLIERYLVEYCEHSDYYSSINSLKELTRYREENSYYNTIWLEQSLLFIYKYQPNKFEPFINSERGNLYQKILSLSINDLLPQVDFMKESVKKRCLVNTELFSSDLKFTLIIFSYFNLHKDILELTTFITDNIARTQAMEYFFNQIDEFSRLSKLALIDENSLPPEDVKSLINNQEISKNEVIFIQESLIKKQIVLFKNFKIKNIDNILSEKDKLIEEYEKLEKLSSNTKEENFFNGLKLLNHAVLLLIEWCTELIKGNVNSNTKLLASKANINLVNMDSFNHLPILEKQIQQISNSIKLITDFNPEKVVSLINNYKQIKTPFIHYFREIVEKKSVSNTYEELEDANEVHLVSLELYLKDNPWANPQILKPKEIYIVRGKLKINIIPSGYNFLKIQSSTTNTDIFELIIDDIKLDNDKLHYEIKGSIIFKYSLNSLEEFISIKLIPFFSNTDGNLYPTIIGYDELITKVLDEKNNFFQTGFKMMNKKVFELYSNPLIQQLDDEEKNDFFTILNGVINYQGYCLQSGKYKGVSNCKEDIFRDELIQHLVSNPNIGENISKESHIAGGRVEINYKGIIVELKVEKKLSERKKIIDKYSNQPLAYSSGNSKLVSIACILDLTEKNTPPSPAINNIFINSVKTHGFQENDSELKPFQVFVFIDGNTKNPSDYSK
ncbi:hypothetical protein ACSTS3_18695 [Aquimarina muelleri]|uniref:hypothetical protein n=1 Tax=Aquimarina muelleri TaxID=279356 RepID=UPI003F689604